MKTLLCFTDLTQDQVHDTAAVFAGYKDYDILQVPIIPDTNLAFEDDLPDFGEIEGAVLNWGDPKIAIVLAVMQQRMVMGLTHEGFRLFVIIADTVFAFQLLRRYDKFCRIDADAAERERGFLVGEVPYEALGTERVLEWRECRRPKIFDFSSTDYLEPAQVRNLFLGWASATSPKGTTICALPGGWWAKMEFAEELS